MTESAADRIIDYVIHDAPLWGKKGNYVLNADLPDVEGIRQREQILTHRVEGHRAIVCCTPFFRYDFLLGDTVEFDDAGLVQQVERHSGRSALRIGLTCGPNYPTPNPDQLAAHVRLHDWIKQTNRPCEWYRWGYVVLDLESCCVDPTWIAYLESQQTLGWLCYEHVLPQ
jgi:hypothetical protein